MTCPQRIVEILLERHGRTFSNELGVDIARNTPSPLYRLLCLSLLSSTRISAELAMRGSRALAAQGWTTPQKLAQSRWRDRVHALNQSGYARYDEKTAARLAELTDALIKDYDGDLRRLREVCGRDPQKIRSALKGFRGIGDTGAGIFMREVQGCWEECYPFADRAALKAAESLELGTDAHQVAHHVPREDFPRLVAALVRTHLGKDAEAIRAASA